MTMGWTSLWSRWGTFECMLMEYHEHGTPALMRLKHYM